MVPAHLTILAQGVLLAAGMTLSAGPAAPGACGDAVQQRAIAVELPPTAQLEEVPAPFHVSSVGEPSQDTDSLLLECENVEVERSDGLHEPTRDEPLIELSTSPRRSRSTGALLIGRDAVASHAARGPPIG